MKILKITLALILSLSILSCESDDDSEFATDATGAINLKFDNSVGHSDFIFGSTYSKSNDESYTIETLKYIVSDIQLTKNDGSVYEYPFEDNIFIIDEADTTSGGVIVNLDGIDAANYTGITFGIGVSQERFLLGAEGQGSFLDTAQEEGMFWAWASGYKFIRLDGTYAPIPTEADSNALNIHMGSVGTSIDNYKTVSLSFPNTVIVGEDQTPDVHIVADISKIFDGTTTANFADGYDQVHMNETETGVIAENMSQMFMVHHVHNE